MRKIFLTFTSCYLLISCGSTIDEPKSEKQAIPVIAVHPKVKDITTYVESIGTFHPSVQIDLHSQVTGIIDEIFVHEGQWIKKDRPLLKIDSRFYEIKLREANAQIQLDRVELEAAQRKIERFRQLAERDLVAQTEWDEIVTHAEKAQAILKLSEARLDTIKLELEQCTIKSPIDGKIDKINVQTSSLINSSGLLLTILQLDPLQIKFSVTEQELAKFPHNNPKIEIHSTCGSSFGSPCATGVVTYLDNYFDTKTGQLHVKGTVDNPNLAFRPGQIIKLNIPVFLKENQLLIPQKAVRYNAEGTYVYVVNQENIVAQQQVVLGEEIDTEVIVNEGIKADDVVITDGHLRANPGSIVEVQL